MPQWYPQPLGGCDHVGTVHPPVKGLREQQGLLPLCHRSLRGGSGRLVETSGGHCGVVGCRSLRRGLCLLSSHSLRSRTRCRPANSILSSASWIRSSEPSDIFIRCAVNVAMFCSRNCVRLQRGRVRSLQSFPECEPLETFIQPLQAGLGRRGAIGGKRRPEAQRGGVGGGGSSRRGRVLVGHSSLHPDPPGRKQLSVASNGETELDQGVDRFSNGVLVANCRYASLTIWPGRLCCRHRYARL